MFDVELRKLDRVNEKIAKELSLSKLPIGFGISEWMGNCNAPFIWRASIDSLVCIDVTKIVNKTDEELYTLVRNKFIKNLTSILDELKK